ncbi:unnamed protein product [Rotaria sp. Silwood2]|nr:unnamed protein product [Rotaria sp. Silwood2]CAF2802944.1 unnamed protein product [Rotaria sp. Silwood2]CAF3211135.1 unnamed protein product [Rotaria sp. Silwood2]CAF3944552.1 unnamed protein product [Rotaria sp. Silwood2]CAF3997591.1 unnamed protein product [Rotaria sp. Silwood2]
MEKLDYDESEVVYDYPIKRNDFILDNLQSGKPYEFHVKAINKASESEPGSTAGRFKITEYPVADATARINGEAVFTVEYDGNPVPEVKWFRNGLEFSSGGRYRISTT